MHDVGSVNKATATFQRQLHRELEGEVLFDAFSRGRYSTDASIYQIEPIGVAIPRSVEDLRRAVQIALENGVPIVARGAGTSQGGQAIGHALIIDTSKFVKGIANIDVEHQTVTVQPGVVLDELNRALLPHGLFFPVDPATANRATIGGMTGNNSAGARSIRYGMMVDNVAGIEAMLSDGQTEYFGPMADKAHDTAARKPGPLAHRLARTVQSLYEREAQQLKRAVPNVPRHVAGYNLHRMGDTELNLAQLLVGSEGTLGVFTSIDLKLAAILRHRALGVCHFPSLRDAMDATQHIVELGPTAVELIDRTLIELARVNPMFRSTVDRFLVGQPYALLLVEFAGENRMVVEDNLRRLERLMSDLGFKNAVVPALDPEFQNQIWSVRKAALNIVMSMKGDGKPVSFIEDCAVPLEHLADYTERLNEVFLQHGVQGTWYAHASVGCLHVRPTLNLKDPEDVHRMRLIAEQAHEVVRQFKGSFSGEHGDGLVRSEFIRPMLGDSIAQAFETIKDTFDPRGLLNPGKIVRPPSMDTRELFRYPPQYNTSTLDTAMDWSAWGGLAGAAEMCNNNGACRKIFDGAMCPSYRVTLDEIHTTRGRANTLRLALSGQLGSDALVSDAMYETMDLCVGCKACRRECPTGVDMARMKVEFLHQHRKRHAPSVGDLLMAHLPRYAPLASRFAPLLNLRNRSKAVARLTQSVLGISAKRRLPTWRRDTYRQTRDWDATDDKPTAVLFVDTFARYFEPEIAIAARRVMTAAGYGVVHAQPNRGNRPLCCGRTYLSAGFVDEARLEARRMIDALSPFVERDMPIVGLEPSCLLTLRDEFPALFPGTQTRRLADAALTFEEFLVREQQDGRLNLALKPTATRALVHGHCHQKAFGVAGHVSTVLNWIPDLEVETIQSSCCGMAGSFGYELQHYDISMRMAELELLPQIRKAQDDTLLVADGTSCRAQIKHGSGRTAHHAATVLASALNG